MLVRAGGRMLVLNRFGISKRKGPGLDSAVMSFDESPARATIVEVGPRDGLQNESTVISTDDKVAFIDKLSSSGLTHIEVTAFVNPARIPQLADAEEVCRRIARRPGVVYSALVPNERGYDRATGDGGLRDVAVFLSASETHNQRNIGCSIAEALTRFEPVLARATDDGVRVRG